MRRSIQVACCFMVANLALMTAPGMLVYGFGGAPLAHWLPPITNDNDFALFGAAGLIWPIGIPVAVLALKPWKDRWKTGLYWPTLLALLYLWTVTVAAFVHLSLGHVVPMPEVHGKRLELDRSRDIRGPDANNNGIRDDIDAWIAAQPISDAQKKALQQSARVRQAELLVDLTNKSERDKLQALSMRSVNCLGDVLRDDPQGQDWGSKIAAITVNTQQRAAQSTAYHRAGLDSGGEWPQGNTCEP